MTSDDKLSIMLTKFSDNNLYNFMSICWNTLYPNNNFDQQEQRTINISLIALQTEMVNLRLLESDDTVNFYISVLGQRIIEKDKTWLNHIRNNQRKARWERLERGLPSWGNLLFAGLNVVLLWRSVTLENKNSDTIKSLQEQIAKSKVASLETVSRFDLEVKKLKKSIDSVALLKNAKSLKK